MQIALLTVILLCIAAVVVYRLQKTSVPKPTSFMTPEAPAKEGGD